MNSVALNPAIPGTILSHFTLQYADGLLGPLVIYGPTTANWDVDLGTFNIYSLE